MLKYVTQLAYLIGVSLDWFPPYFETMFWAVFVLSLIFFVGFFAILILRIMKARGEIEGQASYGNPPVVKEKEIIREIVKIRCPYCGNLYDEKLDKCPHCGGKKP